jgi:hypothetical protein
MRAFTGGNSSRVDERGNGFGRQSAQAARSSDQVQQSSVFELIKDGTGIK